MLTLLPFVTAANKRFQGVLHCAPVLVKDNQDVAGRLVFLPFSRSIQWLMAVGGAQDLIRLQHCLMSCLLVSKCLAHSAC